MDITDLVALGAVVAIVGGMIATLRRKRFDSSAETSRTSNSSQSVPEYQASESESVEEIDSAYFAHLRIKYVDLNGQKSEHEIDVAHVDLRNGRITAFCRLRGDQRTFYAKRIVEAIDLATGEVPVDLKRFLRDARNNRPRRKRP